MKKTRFTEGQIAITLRRAEAATPVEGICRKLRVSETLFYRGTKRYGDMGIAGPRRLRQFEEVNRRLKQLVANLTTYTPSSGWRWFKAIVASVFSGSGSASSASSFLVRTSREALNCAGRESGRV